MAASRRLRLSEDEQAPEAEEELRKGLGEFVKFFNEERIHQSLDYQTPDEVYIQGTFPMYEEEKKAA